MVDINKILEERGKTHGDFTQQAHLTQKMVMMLNSYSNATEHQLNHVQRESIHMICHKLARIATGNPNVKDHWDDIAGYAKLASDRIEER